MSSTPATEDLRNASAFFVDNLKANYQEPITFKCNQMAVLHNTAPGYTNLFLRAQFHTTLDPTSKETFKINFQDDKVVTELKTCPPMLEAQAVAKNPLAYYDAKNVELAGQPLRVAFILLAPEGYPGSLDASAGLDRQGKYLVWLRAVVVC
jgi:hypothetical protein